MRKTQPVPLYVPGCTDGRRYLRRLRRRQSDLLFRRPLRAGILQLPAQVAAMVPQWKAISIWKALPSLRNRKTYKIAVFRHTLCKADSFNDKIAWQQAEEDTNIHIEWIEVVFRYGRGKGSPIMLASDLPDAFLGLLNESHVAKNMSQLVVLNDLLDKYAPNVVEQYAQVPDMDSMMKFPGRQPVYPGYRPPGQPRRRR